MSELGPGNRALHLNAESLWTRLGKKEKESKKKNCSRVLKDARRSAVTFRFRSLGFFFFFGFFRQPQLHTAFLFDQRFTEYFVYLFLLEGWTFI